MRSSEGAKVGTVAAVPVRTLLERLIRERRQTFEEFAEYAERFAREHGEQGTLSVRHLQRLVAGRQPDGTPLRPLRPATVRLLERIFDVGINELLATLDGDAQDPVTPHALRVAVAVVVRGSDVLIVRRRSGESCTLSWQFPAGVVKPGASVGDVAATETFGETAVHCMPVKSVGSRVHPLTRVWCEYVLCEYVAGEVMNADPAENVSVAWVAKSELTRLIPTNQIFAPILKELSMSD